MKTEPEKNSEKELIELKAWREAVRHRIFTSMFEMLFIIGLPALVGFLLGEYLMQNFGWGKWAQVVTLLLALAFSWLVIIKRYRKFDRELKETSRQIAELESAEPKNFDQPKI